MKLTDPTCTQEGHEDTHQVGGPLFIACLVIATSLTVKPPNQSIYEREASLSVTSSEKNRFFSLKLQTSCLVRENAGDNQQINLSTDKIK